MALQSARGTHRLVTGIEQQCQRRAIAHDPSRRGSGAPVGWGTPTLHATGVGKVLLAHAPSDVQPAVLSDLPRTTPYTITQPGLLRRQLARVVRDDYATKVEEKSLGGCSIAVPIRRGPEVAASLGIVVPSLKKDRTKLVGALQVAARGIGRAVARQAAAE